MLETTPGLCPWPSSLLYLKIFISVSQLQIGLQIHSVAWTPDPQSTPRWSVPSSTSLCPQLPLWPHGLTLPPFSLLQPHWPSCPSINMPRSCFSGGPVAKTSHSQCRGPGLIPGQGTWSQMPQLRVCMPQLTLEEEEEVKSLSRVRLFATPWTIAHQAPPSMGFSRQECWSRLPFPSPGAQLTLTLTQIKIPHATTKTEDPTCHN